MPGWVLRGVGTALAALVVVGAVPGTAAAAPGDAEIADAQAERDAAAAQVGAVSARLAAAEDAAARAHQAAQIALQDYEERLDAAEEAQAAADRAAALARQATAEVEAGRVEVASFARDSYMQGSTAPGLSALMSAQGPGELLERASLLEAAGTHRVDVVDRLTVLEEQASAASGTAAAAAAEAETLRAEAATSLSTAQAQERSARTQAAELAEQRTAWEAELAEAQETLYGLEGARAAAEAAAAAAAAAAARPLAPAPAPAPSSGGPAPSGSSAGAPAPSTGGPSSPGPSSGGSSSGGSSSGGSSSGGSASGGTTAGAPSGSAVDTAIAAARSQRGLPYSWGGGGSTGPSYGIPPDTGIYGFDCSGLTQYAYAQAGIAIGGTSREQWYRFRDRQVAARDLRPGDLVFWGSGPGYTSIYHVALYLGNGQVIHAPQSGDVVRVGSMWYGSNYFGAVRPSG
ncbi:NlpC/P60 family protein [Geodermatophilus marinus]|nr:NlpC/P60 family protein [Geodermatophilus sp. LHW52908]